ncbi:PTS beta-glucoside transporter subunit IIABC [Corynebacterium sp. 13CS0277]|uniref:glucose PTS transporter subunit IIA n=1 Tax=Corynebacterium sp. 13CS0277 TaxID=2071994 RepID=UPI000D03372E|nr:PTS glucose transporter subunit IIABC [Corynebacterium sp. 13CS0277]PRQ11338.1 PTS beta-glucoside transporter subunit IIABC [Corynebacterium sp. 13CS0277]
MTTPSAPAPIQVHSPIPGVIVPLADVEDQVFASGAAGDGFGITNTPGGTVVAPVSGTVMMVAKTKHAVGIKTESGLQFLVHLGLDTVELEGAPFSVTVAKGDRVAAGDVIATMDVDKVTAGGKSTTTVVVMPNSKKKLDTLEVHFGDATIGQVVAEATPKVAAPAEATAPAAAAAAAPAPAAASARPADLSGFDALAYDILEGIGGKDNIRNVTHCITRVRFYLQDESRANDDFVKNLDGVVDVVKAGGQYQVVIGPDVEDVYDAITKQAGTGDADAAAAAPKAERPTSLVGWAKLGFSSLIGVITGSMIPVIGLLAASGIIKGILSLLTTFNLVDTGTDTYTLINAMSDAVFYFLPIFVGFTAAKRLGSDPIIIAIVGGVLTYPALVEMGKVEEGAEIFGLYINSNFFGLPFHMHNYTYSIFPIIVAAWLGAVIEPTLKKIIPNMVRTIFLPLVEVVVLSLAIILVFGPIVSVISGLISAGIQGLYDLSPAISGLLIGGFYQCLVIFGLHWAVIPVVAQDIAASGHSYLNAIISATMVAQGGGALAVFVKTRQLKIKELSGSAAIAAMCGITEPAMYGINLKYGRVFITASLGGAVGGFLTGLFNVNMWGFTGSLIGFSSFVNPEGLDFSFWGFLIASAATLVVSFLCTYFFGFKDSDIEGEREVKKVRLGNREPVHK